MWGINYLRKRKLFESLYQKSFCPKPFTVIEFADSSAYMLFSGDTLSVTGQGNWIVESNLFGVYLKLHDESSPWRLGSISDNVITFSFGEFEPKFVRFSGDMNELTEERWRAAH